MGRRIGKGNIYSLSGAIIKTNIFGQRKSKQMAKENGRPKIICAAAISSSIFAELKKKQKERIKCRQK